MTAYRGRWGRGSWQVGGRLVLAPPSGGPAPPGCDLAAAQPGREAGKSCQRSGASSVPGAVSNEQRGAGCPDDPSPLRPLPTAHLVPGKATGKSAAPGTPCPGPSQAGVTSGAQAGGRSGAPCSGGAVGRSLQGAFLEPSLRPTPTAAGPSAPSLQNPFYARRANVAFFLTPQSPPPLGKW